MPTPDLADDSDEVDIPDDDPDEPLDDADTADGPDVPDDDSDSLVGGFDDVDDDGDFEIGEVDIGVDDEDDLVGGFDSVDDGPGASATESGPGDGSSGRESGGSSDGYGVSGVSIQDAIEDGLAEVAVVGLEGPERDRIRDEMHAVASKFKIGYFGEKCAEKYLKTDLQDIPPEYGLAASMIAFFAIAVYKRPDGEERLAASISTLRDRFGGGSDDTTDAEDQTDTDTDE